MIRVDSNDLQSEIGSSVLSASILEKRINQGQQCFYCPLCKKQTLDIHITKVNRKLINFSKSKLKE